MLIILLSPIVMVLQGLEAWLLVLDRIRRIADKLLTWQHPGFADHADDIARSKTYKPESDRSFRTAHLNHPLFNSSKASPRLFPQILIHPRVRLPFGVSIINRGLWDGSKQVLPLIPIEGIELLGIRVVTWTAMMVHLPGPLS